MAKNRIKGITIEIGGDTTDLQKSLKDLDKSLKTTQDQLKDVNKLLKLDPGNTDLLKQKQELLSKSIGETKDRVKQLKDALKEMEKAPNAAETVEQQKALKREIIDTEQNLKRLKEQYRDFGSVAKQQLDVVADKMKAVGTKVTDIGKDLTTKVTLPIVAGFTVAADKASDYEENLNKLSVAFGDYADEVRNFTDNAQTDYGLSKVDASANASAFGALAKGIGLAEDQAADMAIELTKLSADLGSYFNTDVETSANALEAIFTGNAQSLKQFGVVMNETNLKEFAKELGMTDKQFANLASEDKVLLRYQYVLAQTSDAQGDFARTNDGTANTIKSFQATIEDLTTLLGEQLLPIITPIIQKITDAIRKISELDPKIFDTAVKIGLVLAALGPVLSIIGSLISGMGGIVQAIGFLTTPLGTIVLAIGAVVAAGVALYQNWDTIKQKAVEVWDKLKEVWSNITGFITDKIDALKDKFNEFRDKMSEFLGNGGVGGFLGGKLAGLFSSGGMSSGGFMSGGSVVLNASFTINNGNNVDEMTVRQWADVLTERINENLGRMV